MSSQTSPHTSSSTEAEAFGEWSIPANINVSYRSPFTSALPIVFILATGGTIAGSSGSTTSTAAYEAGAIGLEALVQAVPEMLSLANFYGVQVSNIGSFDMDSSHPLALAHIVNDLLSLGSPVAGVVITHGTDTLEETSFFLSTTTDSAGDQPVVMVGAMRPATAMSADGPSNLYQAVATAVHPESKGRGCLVVMNDRISSGFYVQKTHANYLDTFRAPEPGYLGGFYNNAPFYYYAPSPPTFKTSFDISGVNHLPRVDILYGYVFLERAENRHQDSDPRLLDFVASLQDVKGIAIAFPFGVEMALAVERAARVKPVVMSSRINVGMPRPLANPAANAAVINAGLFNTQKSRILLQLALATGRDPREVFEGPIKHLLGKP